MNKNLFLTLPVVSLFLASCIRTEQANTECDIEAVELHFERPTDFFYHDYDTVHSVISTETDIVFTIRSYVNVQSVPTTLRVTDGASVYMKMEDGTEIPFFSGSPVDYSDEQVRHFRVVSQERVWSREYSISIVHDKPSDGNLSFDYETFYLDASGKYYIWEGAELFQEGTWKNGNPGFKISKSSAKPMDYPSTPVVGGGPDGSACVKLETCDTGPFGRMVNMRLASGSMYNGLFDVSQALTNALKATQFGSPFTHKPQLLRVWLRYEPGLNYQDRDGSFIAGVVDEPDIYVVLYRNEDALGNKIQVDGNDVLTNPNIVGLGRLPHHYNPDGSDKLSADPIHGVTPVWQEITIPIEYKAEVDATALENKGYNLIIGAASSWQGAFFKGSIGSKLFIDNMQLFCE